MKNKFSSPILDINKYECPLLETAFVGKDGREYVGAMLIDTGSALSFKTVSRIYPNESEELGWGYG